jgi:stalled ribosome rescue protein Dom34
MTNRVGLWIDRKTAVIVALDDKRASITRLESGVRRLGYRGAPRSKTAYSAKYGQGDNQLHQQYLHHLDKYYKQVASRLRGASNILIFGPGEAKSDLRKHLTRQKTGDRVVDIESADKMTERQILAKVRKHFQ